MRVTVEASSIQNPRGFKIEHRWSPNKSLRLPTVKPQIALIHATVSDRLEGTIQWFLNPGSKVSSDYVIGKDGRIVRMVPHGFAAWHAGRGIWQGKVIGYYNALSCGIELVNMNDGLDSYPDLQLEAMAFVIAKIQLEYPDVTWIRRHASIAFPIGRKTDPMGLDIGTIYETVRRYQPGVYLD